MYESNVSLLEVKKEKDTYQKAQIVTPPPYRRNEF
jgi:hypothetical protein